MSTWLAVLTAAPLLYATATAARVSSRGPWAGQETQFPTFEQVDKNGDGFIDKSEASAVPGLLVVFEKADANRDGRLDKVEFAKALAMVEGNK
jgi:hypothetical protein